MTKNQNGICFCQTITRSHEKSEQCLQNNFQFKSLCPAKLFFKCTSTLKTFQTSKISKICFTSMDPVTVGGTQSLLEGTSTEERQRESFCGGNPTVLAVHQVQRVMVVTVLWKKRIPEDKLNS